MSRFVLSPLARNDIDEILVWSEEWFGGQGRRRYELLLLTAIQCVADDPNLPGSHELSDVVTSLQVYQMRTYHIRHSRNRIQSKRDRVKDPRHFIVYHPAEVGTVQIVRILHDAMDITRHLP